MIQRHVVVIGGGASGTAAAHQLLQAGCRVTIVEQQPRLGGRIHSPNIAGHQIEVGGSFLKNTYSNTLRLLQDLKLADRLTPHASDAAIMRGGEIYQLSASNLAFHNHLLSNSAKWQLLLFAWRALNARRQLDLHDFGRAARLDRRSVRDAFPGHAGSELVNYLLDCALNGYFYWSPEQVSEAMLFMLVKILFQGGPSQTLSGGMQQMPVALTRGCEVMLSTKVERVEHLATGLRVNISNASGPSSLAVDGVVCATTASMVPKIMTLQPDRKVFFESIKYSATAVAVRYYHQAISLPAGAVAFPRPEHMPAAAITRANETGAKAGSNSTQFVKCYASGDLGPQLISASDQDIMHTLDPAKLLHDSALASPSATELQRWPEALPLFEVGHLERLRRFARGHIEDPHTPVVFAGDYLGGPFIEGAVTSGLQAADRLVSRLPKTTPALKKA